MLAGVKFTAVVDPNVQLAQKRIERLRKGDFGQKWADTKAFKTYQEMLESPVRFLRQQSLPISGLSPTFL